MTKMTKRDMNGAKSRALALLFSLALESYELSSSDVPADEGESALGVEMSLADLMASLDDSRNSEIDATEPM